MLLFLVVLTPAQSDGDRCHVYVVDVARAKKALEETRNGGSDQSDSKALSVGHTVFPEFAQCSAKKNLQPGVIASLEASF